MISRQQTQHKQAIALMLGCVSPTASWSPSLPIFTNIIERGYNDANRVLGASM